MVAVEYIIERELLGGRSVALPFVGTLRVEYRGANVEPDLAVAPYGVLTLEEAFREEYSLILIMADEFCYGHYDHGVDLYDIWLATCSDGQSLNIEGVCRVSLSDFTISTYPSFDNMLHPAGHQTLSMSIEQSTDRDLPHPQEYSDDNHDYQETFTHHVKEVKEGRVKKKSGVVGLVLAIVLIVAALTYIANYLYFHF